MNLQLIPFEESYRKDWNKIQELLTSTFLTSFDWIEFQKSLGKEIYQFLLQEEELGTVGIMSIEISKRKIISYAYAPYNPVINWEALGGLHEDIINDAFCQIRKQLEMFHQLLRVNAMRLDPFLDQKYRKQLESIGMKKSLAPAQAIDMWEIDLTQSEEEIRSGMSKSTRHNANKGLRLGIEFIQVTTLDDVQVFGELMDETTKRKGFSNFSSAYFKTQFEYLNKKGLCNLFLAKKGDDALAGVWLNYHKDIAYYTHGASTSNQKYLKLRAPYPLQWYVIQHCKNAGFTKYNMWGILPERVETHAQTGVSSFKKSFGGYEINLVGPYEYRTGNRLQHWLQRLVERRIFREDRY